MTAPIDFFVKCPAPSEPVPQPRPRGMVFWEGGKPRARVYSPDDMRTDKQKERGEISVGEWKERVAREGKRAFGTKAPLDCELQVKLSFHLPRPEAHFRTTVKEGRVLRLNAPVWHTVRPDTDNLAKAVLDALTGIAWTDDNRIAQLYIEKRYAAEPGVRVVILAADEQFIEPELLMEAGRE